MNIDIRNCLKENEKIIEQEETELIDKVINKYIENLTEYEKEDTNVCSIKCLLQDIDYKKLLLKKLKNCYKIIDIDLILILLLKASIK